MHRLFWLLVPLTIGCASGGSSILLVELKTDILPGVEFSDVETILRRSGAVDGRTIPAHADPSLDFLQGVRVAVFDAPLTGTLRMSVLLRDSDGTLVATRDTILTYDGGAVGVTVVITRDCLGVTCPAVGDDARDTECLARRCVPPTCSVADPESCGAGLCSTDADCTAVSSCATHTCSESVCLFIPLPDACAPDAYCAADLGCRPLDPDCLDGAACITGNPCETGIVDCSTGRAVCRVSGPARAGTPCREAAGVCDTEETCDGVSEDCPSNGFLPMGTVCRASTVCGDAPESCSGSAATCPPDNPTRDDCTVAYRSAGTFMYTVPVGCTQLRVRAWGAGGGDGLGNMDAAAGGSARGTVAVTEAETLTVAVGGAGQNAIDGGTSAGGLHGGGLGANGSSSQGGGGGGGFSAVFRGGITQANALVLAGGGGGSGGGCCGHLAGAGGGSSAQAAASGGGGGTPTAGGAGSGNGAAGSALQGGAGGPQSSGDGGGGGGGGYFGGGGGSGVNTDAPGGGGGSGFVAAGATATLLEAGNRSTPGQADDSERMTAGNRGVAGAVLLECL